MGVDCVFLVVDGVDELGYCVIGVNDWWCRFGGGLRCGCVVWYLWVEDCL